MHGWVNYVLVVDKSALEMKIDELIADRVWDSPFGFAVYFCSVASDK